MSFFKKFIPKEIRKPFKSAAKTVRKIIPREIRPGLPFLAAATPFLLPGNFAIGGLNPALSRGIMSSLANIGSQGVMDPEGEINLLSAALAGATGALGADDVAKGMRLGIEGIPPEAAMARGPAELGMTTRVPGFFQGAENIGREGIAQAADFISGAGDTFSRFAASPGEIFKKGGAKALGKAAAVPLAQGTGDLAYAFGSRAAREFEEAQAEELRQAGLSETEMMLARRNAITEAMTDALFNQEDIDATLDELGLLNFAQGGRVGYAKGKVVKEGGLAALRLFRRPRYSFEDEAKMTLDLTKTGRYTEKELLELDGDQIAEIYEYEGFTPPAPIERSSKIIDMEEMMKNVTPEDKADGGIAGLKDGGMLDFGGKEMDLRGGGFVPIGKKEKADDVPARLSKNEFVMTADAVRAAGGGSVNEGAKRMYKVMNDLEARA